MNNDDYDVYCQFDIEKHKQTYANYLEVIIYSTGHIEYAVPSHQQKLEKIAAKRYGCSVQRVRDMCPTKCRCDYNTWLCYITNCILVWNNHIEFYKISREHKMALRKLKMNGLYSGRIPNIGETNSLDVSEEYPFPNLL